MSYETLIIANPCARTGSISIPSTSEANAKKHLSFPFAGDALELIKKVPRKDVSVMSSGNPEDDCRAAATTYLHSKLPNWKADKAIFSNHRWVIDSWQPVQGTEVGFAFQVHNAQSAEVVDTCKINAATAYVRYLMVVQTK